MTKNTMNENTSSLDSVETDKLRKLVQEKEAEILTEILATKQKRAQMIKKAREKAKILYKEKLEQLEAKIKALEEKLHIQMSEIMQMLERREQEFLDQMEECWEQHKDEALKKCLKRILP